ncbi:MAG TPA: outer membrane beta-barrel protein, partial [Puia sp.]|nr:outer membrane beta-barrel protein [Puia sp.]
GALVLLIGTATFFIIKSRNNRIDSTLNSSAGKSANVQSREKSNPSSPSSSSLKQADNQSSASKKDDNTNHANGVADGQNAPETGGESAKDNGSSTQNGNSKAEPQVDNHQKLSRSSNSSVPTSGDAGLIGSGQAKNSTTNTKNSRSKALLNSSAVGAGVAAAASTDAINQPGNHLPSQNNNLVSQSTEDMRWATLPGLASGYAGSPNLNSLGSQNSRLLNNGVNTGLSKTDHNNQSLKIFNPLKIGFMIAPDFSNVKAADNNRLSINVGLTLGYQIAKRWSINTGFIYTIKNYAANGKDFHGAKDMWPPSVQLDYVKGTCNMIEVPLSLRYDFSKAK